MVTPFTAEGPGFSSLFPAEGLGVRTGDSDTGVGSGRTGTALRSSRLMATASSSNAVRDLSDRSRSPNLSRKCSDLSLTCSGFLALILAFKCVGVALGEISFSDEQVLRVLGRRDQVRKNGMSGLT